MRAAQAYVNSAFRSRHLHGRVDRMSLLRRDPHYAEVLVAPVDAHGGQRAETADEILVDVAGRWIVVADGTDLSVLCVDPTAKAIRDLVSRR